MTDFDKIDFDKMIKVIDAVYDLMKDMPFELFTPSICMLLEMKCKDDGMDMIETTEAIAKSAKEVTNVLGKY